MKTCSRCGTHYPDYVMVCPADQQPLGGEAVPPAESLAEPAARTKSPKATCRACGATDDCTRTAELRGRFGLTAFLLGGIEGLVFRNAGRARQMYCNRCGRFFYFRGPFGKLARVLYWLTICPRTVWLLLLPVRLAIIFFAK